MRKVNFCPKKLSCSLWQVICDGTPCFVEKEIETNSYNIKGRYFITRRNHCEKRPSS